ncbi:hypothetical protein H5410_019439 [Solanum commersonii]|uniref:Uncharacterized protein n=1 Tax=Solanum commersonii TaxID=4109 RepID=A0A9J5ZB71_SOLCO|nr:hypothetical protein H5410_019439 [Solanum commersonii]
MAEKETWKTLTNQHSHGKASSILTAKELLVFGNEILAHVIYRYSILTNTWSSGMEMNTTRCLLCSASIEEIAILGSGCDSWGQYT